MNRGRKGARNPPRDDSGIPRSKIGESVPERALKGRSISNRVIMKDAGICPPQGTTKFEYLYGREPFVKFDFKYRSHSMYSLAAMVEFANVFIEDLQIEGIIPAALPSSLGRT